MEEQKEAGNGVTTLQLLSTTKPVVLKTKKKKKYKYSRGLKDLQRSGRKMTKVSSRLVRAMSKGVGAYRKASDKSARKKRDGAMRDFGLNVAKGMSKSLRESSRTPYDIAQALNGRSSRKLIRRQVRATARMARLFRVR